jgi:hypothetical protein
MSNLHTPLTKSNVTSASTRVVAVSDSDLTPRPALNQDELDLARAGHVAQLSRKLGFWVSAAPIKPQIATCLCLKPDLSPAWGCAEHVVHGVHFNVVVSFGRQSRLPSGAGFS